MSKVWALPILEKPAGEKLPTSAAQRYRHIANELIAAHAGEVRFSDHDQMLWSTDASNYQVRPLGVVLPRDAQQAQRALAICVKHRLPVLPRGGGTSLAGQCTNRAVVIDFSAGCRRIVSVDTAGRKCVVEPGITIDELNRHLATLPGHLFFAPDPATVAQACIGGCIGNNAAGARSIRWGRTSENVIGVQLLLSTGQPVWLRAGAGRQNTVALSLADAVAKAILPVAAEIRRRFPKLIRRNAGYALDLVLTQLDAGISAADLDLSGLICGSEGTLGLITAAELKLHNRPTASGLALLAFGSLEAAIERVPAIVATRPTAVELLDDTVLTAATNNTEYQRYLDLMPQAGEASPAAVLYVEYQEESQEQITAAFERLRQLAPGVPLRLLSAAEAAKAWQLRKAGEALLHGIAADCKPITFVEDNAVPVERLGEFVARFKEIVASHGTSAAYYAHASVGVLHIRPLLNLHRADDLARMQSIAVQAAALARDCGGVMSGEHGDGRVRGPLLAEFYGEAIIEVFKQIKHIFDPTGLLNPGMIVDAGPIASIAENLRLDSTTAEHGMPHAQVADNAKSPHESSRGNAVIRTTYFDYAASNGLAGALELCNGAGFCRKTAGGTMCPSYRATLDERHSPRGRANALRAALMPPAGGPIKLHDAATLQTLDACLSCKACKSECPSNVDIARLKSEYLAQGFRRTGWVPLNLRAFAAVRHLNRLGSVNPRWANKLQEFKPVRAILNRLLGLAPQRSLPPFGPPLTRISGGNIELGGPKVVLYNDCFTGYGESRIGVAAISMLQWLGYDVELADVGCCGRPMISNGLLPQAIRRAAAALKALAPAIESPEVRAILFLEPSCLSAVKDDWPALRLPGGNGLAQRLAAKAGSVEDFVDAAWNEHPYKPELSKIDLPRVLFHGHCHQKALGGADAGSRLLRRLLGDHVTVLDSGCCGMAGAFGMTKKHYDLSIAIGRDSLFNLVEQHPADAMIATAGCSCRHQLLDGLGRHAVHPVELATMVLAAATAEHAARGPRKR